MKTAFTRVSKLCLGGLSLIAGLNSAQAVPLASATASLTNLKLTLVDLDPSDGIAPSVTFGPGFLSAYGQQVSSESGYLVTPTGAIWGSTASGSSEGLSYDISPTSIALGTSVNSADFGQALPPENGSYFYNAGSTRGLEFASASPEDTNNYWRVGTFTLSANTGFFISGMASTTATTASHADVVAAATASFDPTTVDLSQLYADNFASAEISITLASSSVLSKDWYAQNVSNSMVSNIQRSAQFYGSGDEAAELQDNSPFVLSFANGSTESVEGSLALAVRVGVNTYAYALANNPPNVPTIPEPSTCLLMGLGLVGIGAARSRHPAAKAA